MRPGPQALLPFVALVVGFVAGTGFGVVVLSDSSPETVVVETRSGRSGGPAASADGETESGRSGPSGAGETTRRRAVDADEVLIDNAMRSSGAMPATTGTGVVNGTILDHQGRPLPGVRVTATTSLHDLAELPPGYGDEDDDEEASLEARIRRVVVEHRFEQATRRTATTGPNGEYQLSGLIDATYFVSPELTGWRFESRSGDWSASPGDTRSFIARPVIGVTVNVLLPDGKPAEKATILYTRTGSGNTESVEWSSKSDPLELDPGMYSFGASAGPHGSLGVHEVSCEVLPDQPNVVDLQLTPRPGVLATIEFAGEERPLSVGLAAMPLDGGAAADPAALLAAPHSAWSGPPFELALLDLPPGSYLVGAVLRTGTVLGSVVLEIADAPVEHVFSASGVDVRDYVAVKLIAPDGSHGGDASFQVGWETPDGNSFNGGVAAEMGSDGTFHVPMAVPGGPESDFQGWSRSGGNTPGTAGGATYFVTAHSARFGSKRVEYYPARDRRLEIRFDEPAFAVVTVSGYSSSQWRGRVECMLNEVASAGSSGNMWLGDDQRRMSPQGVARVGPVAPGSYLVSVMISTEDNGYRRVSDTEVVLGVGDTPVTVSIPDLHELVMVVEGQPLDLDLHRDPRPDQTTDFLEEGVMDGQRTTFPALAPGRYRVRHFGEGSTGEMMVDVPASGTVTFRPTPYNSYRVENVPDNLQGHLQRGDVITAIAGETMDSERRLRAALALAGTQDTVQVTIRRGGQVIEAEVPSAGLEYGTLTYWVR